MISRRTFLNNSIIATVGTGTLGFSGCLFNKQKILKVIAYNVYKCAGWPTENVKEGKDVPNLIAQELSKYSPDIINFSESPDEAVVKKIADTLKMDYVFFPSGGKWPGAILSNHKIINHINVPIVGVKPEDLFTRHWGRATIQVSNQDSIIINSVHLHPFAVPEFTEVRKREISEILKSLKKEMEENKSIILMGDFNLMPDTKEYEQLVDAGFVDSYIKAGEGNGLTIQADSPTKRIDYIWCYGPISKTIAKSRALFEGAFRTNPEDSNSFALSDHLPQFAEVKI